MNDNTVPLPPPPIGLLLGQLRRRKKLSLNKIALRAGTSPAALHRYESGWDRFELRTLRRLAAALGARVVLRLEPLRPEAALPAATATELVVRWRTLFWDVDLTTRHLQENRDWVLRRILRFGDWEAVHQARRFCGDDAVRRAVEHRSMDVRTRTLWRLVLGHEEDPT